MPLDHVVLFDFAPDTSQYLQRIGCATRGDAKPARVTALAVGPQVPFAKALLAHDAQGSAHAENGNTTLPTTERGIKYRYAAQ